MKKKLTLTQRVKKLEEEVFRKTTSLCKRCGSSFQIWEPSDVGPKCMSCGSKEFAPGWTEHKMGSTEIHFK